MRWWNANAYYALNLARLMLALAGNPDQRRVYAAGAAQTYSRNYSEDQVYRQFRRVLEGFGL